MAGLKGVTENRTARRDHHERTAGLQQLRDPAEVRQAPHAGETSLRLNLVAAWRDTKVFTDAERAALELTEQGTRIADGARAATTSPASGADGLRLVRYKRQKRGKQSVNVVLVFPPVNNLTPIACALDIDSARSAGCDRDLLAPRAPTQLRPGLDLPGFRVRSGDAKPALRYRFHTGLKNLIRGCRKVRSRDTRPRRRCRPGRSAAGRSRCRGAGLRG